jgi:hypothetical protein
MSAFNALGPREAPRGMRWRTPILAALLGVLALAASAVPATAAPPTATTDPADGITPVGATLHGRVDPRGAATGAFFQYGLTKKYGKRTPAQNAGINPGLISIAANVTGLQSNKIYHFRTVAESKDGKRFGIDRKFRTAKPTTTPGFSPNPVPYGAPVTVTGKIVGSGAAGAEVSLFGRVFPYTDPFQQFGNTVIANQQGDYLFVLSSALSTTQFQVRGKTNPAFTSATQTLFVSSRISLHTPRTVRRGRRVYFWGRVLPGQDGIVVEIQRRRPNGTFSVFTRTTLKPRPGNASGYSTRKRLYHSSTFRAVVKSAGGVVVEGTTVNTHRVQVKRR